MADFGKTVIKQFQKLRQQHGYGVTGDREAERFFRANAPTITDEQLFELVDGFATLKGSKKKLQFVRVEPYYDTYISADNGWLSPEGRFYPCEYAGHQHLASWLRRGDPNPELALEDEGWIKAQHCGGIGDAYWFFTGDDIQLDEPPKRSKVTEAQIRLVSERCMELKIQKPYWCRSREDD